MKKYIIKSKQSGYYVGIYGGKHTFSVREKAIVFLKKTAEEIGIYLESLGHKVELEEE
jgi:hypothetical protein